MPRTPDRQAGDRSETATVYDDTAPAVTTQEGELRYSGGVFRLRDSVGEYDPRTGGGGLSKAAHDALRSLIHFIDDGPAEGFVSGAFREIAGSPFPTSVIWWESAAKTQKIVELTVTRDAGQKPTTEVWETYDTDGTTVLATVTDTIAYSGPFEVSRTRAIA